jgi:hypothetical protein
MTEKERERELVERERYAQDTVLSLSHSLSLSLSLSLSPSRSLSLPPYGMPSSHYPRLSIDRERERKVIDQEVEEREKDNRPWPQQS